MSGVLKIDQERLAALPAAERERVVAQLVEVERAFKLNPLLGFRPHSRQVEFMRVPAPPLRAFFGGNRSGKTTATMVDTIIQCVDREALPEHLASFKRWEPPFYCRVVTPDLSHTLEGVVLQKFREWCPREQLKGGSLDRAYDKTLRMLWFKNGSWVQFFSNDQDLDKFGGAALHRIVYDEEPRSDVRRECLMRLIDYGGEEVFGMTPLNGMCVDTATEALTRRGWLRWDQLREGDAILSWNVERGETEWSPLLAVYRDAGYAGPMLRTEGHLDAVFTPEHKWVTDRGLVRYDDLKKTDRARVAGPHRNLNPDGCEGAAFWELVGWFLAEGSVVPDENKMVLYQSSSRYPENCARIEHVLEVAGAQYHVGDNGYRTANGDGNIRRYVITGDVARRMRWVVGDPKRLTSQVLSGLSVSELDALLVGLMGGDGHVCESGKWEFTTCDSALADAVAMAFVLRGFRTNVREYDSPSSRVRGDRPVYRVTGSGREKISEFRRRAKPTVLSADGVWCPTTPNGTWVARRNGTVFITGNSWVFDEIYEPWEAGRLDPELGRVVVVDMNDNPHLDRVTQNRLLASFSEEERQARQSGRFVSFSGLIYPSFSTQRHVLPADQALPINDAGRPSVPPGVEVMCGIDPGYRHMCAVVFCYLDERDRLVVFDEIAAQQKTVKQVCQEIRRRCELWSVQPNWFVIDPASRNKNNQTGRSDQQEFADNGIVTIPGQNAVGAGINRVKERLDATDRKGDPVPRLLVAAHCDELRGEFRRYRWAKESTRREDASPDKPVKRDDHLLDALRYVVMQRPLAPDPEMALPNLTQKDRLLRASLKALRMSGQGGSRKMVDHPSGPGLFD